MLDDLRAFLGRYSVIELLVAFALALAVIDFLRAVISGLVISPIDYSGSYVLEGGGRPLNFVIAGRAFQAAGILGDGLLVVLAALGAAVLIRGHGDVLWQEEGEFVKCPHCLTEIPAEARVCSACTRDVPREP